jgi:hypothetical protein
MNKPQKVDIRPGVKMLAVLSSVNYSPWFAIAEFVDNSIQSFLDYEHEIKRQDGDKAKLKVEIELDSAEGGDLIVRDNAAGIHEVDYHRAFRPADIPPDTSGLSEFGMGMKSAACWFSPIWEVRTTALGEAVERTVRFDIAEIVEDNLEELIIESSPIEPSKHFTEIRLSTLHRPPQGRTIGKIQEYLASIYRVFIREELLDLHFRGRALSYEEPEILYAPFHKGESKAPQLWKKEIDFDFGTGLRVHGFAALRETMSQSPSGFSLFRRKRLIQGVGDECYRPAFIGPLHHSLARRLFGDLHLEGFNVSHTKDGFQWDENEEPFLELLKDELDTAPLPLLSQGRSYLARSKTRDLKKGAEISTLRTSKIVKEEVPPVIERLLIECPEDVPPPSDLPSTKEIVTNQTVSFEIYDQIWEFSIELTNDSVISDWLSISDDLLDGSIKRVTIRISLVHPFMLQYSGTEAFQIEPLQRLAIAIAVAEITSREMKIKMAGTFRRTINDLLRNALWKT